MKSKKKWWSNPEPAVGDLISIRPYSKVKKGYGDNAGLVVAKTKTDYVVMWFKRWKREFSQLNNWKFKRYEIRILQRTERNKKNVMDRTQRTDSAGSNQTR